jgi:hypothetical protein
MKMGLVQAYRQTPWRIQAKWFSRFLLVVVGVVMVAGLYLSISAQTASAGIEMQRQDIKRDVVQRDIADLRSQAAYLTSENVMEARARTMDYEFTEPGQVTYIVVSGYRPPLPPNLAPPPGMDMIAQPLIKSSYTISLWDLVTDGAGMLGSRLDRGS